MSNPNDYFADVPDYAAGTEGQYGVFAGGGAAHVFNVSNEQVTPDGPVIGCTCQNCGTPLQYVPSWQEVAILSQRMAPRDDQTGTQWLWSNEAQAFIFPHTCRVCSRQLKTISVSPDEAQRMLRRGVSQNVVSGQLIDQYIARARASAAAAMQRGY